MYSDEGGSPQPNWGSLSSKNRADPDINKSSGVTEGYPFSHSCSQYFF